MGALARDVGEIYVEKWKIDSNGSGLIMLDKICYHPACAAVSRNACRVDGLLPHPQRRMVTARLNMPLDRGLVSHKLCLCFPVFAAVSHCVAERITRPQKESDRIRELCAISVVTLFVFHRHSLRHPPEEVCSSS